MVNEIYLNMYRVAVKSERLPLEFIPDPYRKIIADEADEVETPTE